MAGLVAEKFELHMGAGTWTDPAYRQDASTWNAAWRAALAATPAKEIAPVALSDEQIEEIFKRPETGKHKNWVVDFARAIEAHVHPVASGGTFPDAAGQGRDEIGKQR